MALVYAILGAALGLIVGSAGGAATGFVGGIAIGLLYARTRRLADAVARLERHAGIEAPAAQAPARVRPAAAAQAGDVPARPAATGWHEPSPESTAVAAAARTAGNADAPEKAAHTANTADAADNTARTANARATMAAAARSADVGAVGSPDGATDTTSPATAAQAAPPRPAPAAAARPPVFPARNKPRTDTGPSLDSRIVDTLKRWLTEGNLPVKFGAVILFVGVASGLKYMLDAGLIEVPMWLRLVAVAAVGVAMLGFGFRERVRRRVFGISMEGAGIGIVLLTTFAAYRLYGVLDAGPAFAIVIGLVALAATLAVRQDAVVLAVLGFAAGYLAPILLSTGSGNHVALFGWYAVLNAAVLLIAWLRAWRALNVMGFVFTYAIGYTWGWQYYRPEHYATVAPFVLLFFAFYVAVPLLYATRRDAPARGLVDALLVFGTPVLSFGAYAALKAGDGTHLGIAALVCAALYSVLALFTRRDAALATLTAAYALIAIGFTALAVPLALSERWTAAVWSLQGAALTWYGLRVDRRVPRWMGLALQAAASIAWIDGRWADPWQTRTDWVLLFNPEGLSLLLLALGPWLSGWLYTRRGSAGWVSGPLLGLGALWWYAFVIHECVYVAAADPLGPAFLLAIGASAALFALARFAWPRIGWLVVVAAFHALPLVFASAIESGPPLYTAAPWSLIALFAGLWAGLAALGRAPTQRAVSWTHLAALLALAASISLDASVRLFERDALGEAWLMLTVALPAVVLVLGLALAPRVFALPLAALWPRYRTRVQSGLGLVLGGMLVAGLFGHGDPAPLPYLPLLNPLDTSLVGLLVLLTWLARPAAPQVGAWLVALWRYVLPPAAFVVVSNIALRGVHHLADLPWSIDLLDARVSQTTLTVVWCVCGVTAWIAGSRRGSRPLWTTGAVLMGIVLLKLIAVDRNYVGNLPGIVSFVAVGVLLMVVGYLAPSPPRAAAGAR